MKDADWLTNQSQVSPFLNLRVSHLERRKTPLIRDSLPKQRRSHNCSSHNLGQSPLDQRLRNSQDQDRTFYVQIFIAGLIIISKFAKEIESTK